MLENLLLVLLFLILLLCGLSIFLHAPLFKLKEVEKDHIKENGLIHFTSHKKVLFIQKEGLKGKVSHMGGIEKYLGKLIWTYPYSDKVESAHDILINKKRGKEDCSRYNTCLRLQGFSENELNNMYKRIGFFGDKAIVYKGENLFPKRISILKKW